MMNIINKLLTQQNIKRLSIIILLVSFILVYYNKSLTPQTMQLEYELINTKDMAMVKVAEKKTTTNNKDGSKSVFQIYKEMKTFTNAIIVLKILLYGFIALVTLIGVTSVINTINTSMALRKKEFAVLRSIGLTPKGFNKMLLFECFLFGFKSLLYSIPVSIGIIYLFHRAFGDLVTLNNLLIPYDSILIATISVFIIVLISMMYATSKIKKANILDAIREKNI